MFMTPADMAPGRYYLTVRTKVDDEGNRLVGELRFLLTVLDPTDPEPAEETEAEAQTLNPAPIAV
jgi:hypothetical protein